MSTEEKGTESGANSTETAIQIKDDSPALEKQSDEEHASASLIKDDENEKQSFETSTVELPRDILTAYILCRLLVVKDSNKASSKLKHRWDELSRLSKGCILFGLIGSYAMQFAVFFSFTANLNFSNFSTGVEAQDWWFNLIAIAALFMYLWKDVIAFYNSVWFWIGKIEEERGFTTSPDKLLGKMTNQMKNAATDIAKKDKEKKKKTESSPSRSPSASPSISPTSVLKEYSENMSFLQFRIGLIAVFVLYGGYAAYSLLAIGNYKGDLVEKMSVAIQIFFILEIDDWACSLFILNPGVLDDGDFDQEIMVNAKKEEKRVERRLLATTLILVISVLSVYTLSNYKSVI